MLSTSFGVAAGTGSLASILPISRTGGAPAIFWPTGPVSTQSGSENTHGGKS
jgi:hypothetical protein